MTQQANKIFNLEEMATSISTTEEMIEAVNQLHEQGASYRCIDKFVYLVNDQIGERKYGWCSISYPRLGRQAADNSYYGYYAHDWCLCPIVNNAPDYPHSYIIFEEAESTYDEAEEEEFIRSREDDEFNKDLQMEINELA